MKIIFYIIQKEFIHIFRNRLVVRILFVMPFLQLLVLSYAANFEIRNIRLHIVDQDCSGMSRSLVEKMQSSGYFIVDSQSFSVKNGIDKIENDETDALVAIPDGFETSLNRREPVQVQLLINAINGTKAALANSYLNAIIRDFGAENAFAGKTTKFASVMPIDIAYRNWYNPEMDYKIYMSPGILVMLATIISLFLASINIVREKEIGTIEQLNVTTIGKGHFVIGKLAPFWLIGLVDFFAGLLFIWILFDVPIEGSLFTLFLFLNLYLFALLGFGMFISTITHTQQQAMFISWFFMVIFVLLSGLFTPIEFMPDWAKAITKLNPVAYFVEFMRNVMLKGSEFRNVAHSFAAMAIYAIAINSLAVLNYKKTTA